MKRHLLTFFLLIAVLAVSCKHEPIIPDEPESQFCDPDSVYFVNDIEPFLNSNCAYSGCHDAGTAQNGVNLSSYAQIIATGDVDPSDPTGSDIYEVLIDSDPNDRMPPASENNVIAQEQINMLLTWIEQGARNNECIDTIACDTTAMSYANDVDPILSSRCGGQSCHGSSAADGGFGLMTYPDVQTQANSGGLIGAIFHQNGWSPMPDGQPMMDSCTINTILAWVNQGALDN